MKIFPGLKKISGRRYHAICGKALISPHGIINYGRNSRLLHTSAEDNLSHVAALPSSAFRHLC
ncbi:hypothetical protein EAJ17_10455 [Akkermansia sp. aa_0143]|nr:hypothetical protein EAJ17_10455 [Akkermansia sp. aa_0143]